MSDLQVRTANIIADTGDPEGEVKCLVIDRDTFTQLIANLEEIKKRYIDLPERKIRWGSKILTFTFLRIFYYFSIFFTHFPPVSAGLNAFSPISGSTKSSRH